MTLELVHSDPTAPGSRVRRRARLVCRPGCGLTFIGDGWVSRHADHTWTCDAALAAARAKFGEQAVLALLARHADQEGNA